MTFGEKLREHRQRTGASQVTLAKWSGVDRTFISRLEADDRAPSANTMWELGKALGLTGPERCELWLLVLEDAAQVAAP